MGLFAVSGLPPGAILSVRAGTTRRQVLSQRTADAYREPSVPMHAPGIVEVVWPRPFLSSAVFFTSTDRFRIEPSLLGIQ